MIELVPICPKCGEVMRGFEWILMLRCDSCGYEYRQSDYDNPNSDKEKPEFVEMEKSDTADITEESADKKTT